MFFEDLLCLIIKGHNHLSDIYGMAGSAPGVFSMCSLITFTTSLQGCRLILLNGWKKEWRKCKKYLINTGRTKEQTMMNNTLEGINHGIIEVEEQVSDLEDRMVGITATELNRERTVKRNRDSLKRPLGQHYMHQHSY